MNRSGNATAILLIIALVVGIASTALIITITRTNPQTKASASVPLLPETQPIFSKDTASESTQVKFTAPTPTNLPAGQAGIQQPVTSNSVLASGDVDVATALSTDKTTLAIDFIALSFTPISTITYTITYTADVSGLATPKSIQGTFAPATVLITGYKTTGYPYIRKTFTLGTCSGSTCTYDTNPRNFSVSASVKLSGY